MGVGEERRFGAMDFGACTRLPKEVERREEAISWAGRIKGEMEDDCRRLAAAQAGHVTLLAGTLQLMAALRGEALTLWRITDKTLIVSVPKRPAYRSCIAG